MKKINFALTVIKIFMKNQIQNKTYILLDMFNMFSRCFIVFLLYSIEATHPKSKKKSQSQRNRGHFWRFPQETAPGFVYFHNPRSKCPTPSPEVLHSATYTFPWGKVAER